LVIAAGITDTLDPIAFGAILVSVNLVLLVVVGWVSFRAFVRQAERDRWGRGRITLAEMQLVDNVMNSQVGASDVNDVSDSTERPHEVNASAGQRLLQQVLLPASEVQMTKRLGAGSFGEVFIGNSLGQTVAVKTMLTVTEASVKAFRAEILLTATLRHPNIITFVGACWGQDLICLVLEYAPNGSLEDLLRDKSRELRWEEPLLRLTMDVARGMAYLHGRSYFDEEDGRQKDCVMHRDLKVCERTSDRNFRTPYTFVKKKIEFMTSVAVNVSL
jgi:hypothetical protein